MAEIVRLADPSAADDFVVALCGAGAGAGADADARDERTIVDTGALRDLNAGWAERPLFYPTLRPTIRLRDREERGYLTEV
jgi:hypothetical protein